jgi:hypothetical protein
MFKLWTKQTISLDIGPWIPEWLSWILYLAPLKVGCRVMIAPDEQKGVISDSNDHPPRFPPDGSFVVKMLDKDGGVIEAGERTCTASELLSQDRLRQYIVYEHQGGADIGVTSFILHSTVAMIVFDLLGVTATLAYETPISRDAVVSAIFSLGAGFYGMLGKCF